MRIKPKYIWFLAFTAIFAVLASVVFWGTWAEDVVPIMPDCPTLFSIDYSGDFCRNWLLNGKFVPGDIIAFIGNPYFWVELKYVLALFFAAFALSYFLIGRGLSRFAAYSAGLFLAFCGYWCTLFSAGHLGWFQWMTYGVFAFGLIDRMLEKGKLRHSVMLGAVVAWGSFYQADLWLIFTFFTSIYFVFRSIMVRPGWKAWALRSIVALAVFVGIGLPSFRSALYSDLAGRDKQIEEGQTLTEDSLSPEEKRWRFVTDWSMPPEDTKEFFVAGVHGDTSCPMTLAIGKARNVDIKPYEGRLGRPLMPNGEEAPSGNLRQHSLYVGWVTCIFALLGVVSMFFSGDSDGKKLFDKRVTVAFFLTAAVVFWVFSMGRYVEGVYRCVFALPFGDYLRAPVKWHHLTEFCIVVLAAYGLHFAWKLISPYGNFARVIFVAVVLYGAYDLAVEAKKFCAPHSADTTVYLLQVFPEPVPLNIEQFNAVNGRKPTNKEIRKLFEERYLYSESLKSAGLTLVGTVKNKCCLETGVQVYRDFCVFMYDDYYVKFLESQGLTVVGPVKKNDFEFPVVKEKTPRPRIVRREHDKELSGFAFAAAATSLALTVLTLLYLSLSSFVKRFDRIKILKGKQI